jgi:hypothetical protein
VGLWNFCDDAGRHPWSAKQVKAEIFPADSFTEAQISDLLQELSKNGLITAYESENKQYFYVPGWKHQRIDKPQPPKYPDPFAEHSKIIRGTLPPDTIRYDTIREDTKLSLAQAAPAKAEFSKQFLEFFDSYPKRKSKKDAAKAYAAAIRDVSHETIMAGLARAKLGWRDPQFIPYPASWLRAGGWDDEPTKTGGANGTLTPSERAFEFAERARQIEIAKGLRRPADDIGSDRPSRQIARIVSQR